MAKPVATAASTALPPLPQDIGADPRGDFFLRDHHAVFGDNGVKGVGRRAGHRPAAHPARSRMQDQTPEWR